MSEDIKYIRGKMDDLEGHVGEINKTLAVNTTLLDEHIKRTNQLEEKLEPVEDHVKSVHALLFAAKWGVGLGGGIVGIAYGISRFI